jgi:hypothetical protein
MTNRSATLQEQLEDFSVLLEVSVNKTSLAANGQACE